MCKECVKDSSKDYIRNNYLTMTIMVIQFIVVMATDDFLMVLIFLTNFFVYIYLTFKKEELEGYIKTQKNLGNIKE